MANDKMTSAVLAEQMAILRNAYLERLPAELDTLNLLAVCVHDKKIDHARLDELYHRLHKLAGSGGTFGLAALSANARNLERQAKIWLENSLDVLDPDTSHAFVNDIAALAATLEDIDTKILNPLSLSLSAVLPLSKTIRVWLVEDDIQLGQELALQLESFSYLVRLFPRIDDAENAAQSEQPDILLMDVMFEHEGENSTQVLNQRPNLRKLDCPLLFISSMDDFQSRVRASQLGAQGYILKPLDIPRLVSRMAYLMEQRHAPQQRVLIVDDDEALAAHYRLVLMGAGMEAEVLHQPEAIIEKISAFRPELVLMDMHMPVYSGPDLAGVIRQHDNYVSLPLVYLSAETDLDKQIKAMNRGADDFLTKPISDAQLVAAVRVRIERARQLEAQISKDSLTGLLKHSSIKEAVEQEVIRARRNGKPATVAMLDIDHFKKVNDTYGHAMGDVVISSIAMMLRQRMRQSDIIGRYGGEEFVVMLPECDIEHAQLLLDDVRVRFAAVHFIHKDKDFGCTISAGLACINNFPASSGAELLVEADAALYVAKFSGRNQVRAAPVNMEREVSKP
jgi:diguanylate cyclase (GGDEF)-like protein